MKVTTEDLGHRQVLLTVEVDEERVEKALRGVARRLSRQYTIPGFRRGRAPYHVILQRFGREALLQECLEDLTQEIYQEAVEGQDLQLYGMGELEDMQLDPLVFKLRLPLRPLVELGDYRELRLEPPVVTVDEEEIDAELEKLRQANTVMEPAGDRPAYMGDMVSLDVSTEAGDESFTQEEGRDIVLDAEDHTFAPGFPEQIVGLKAGEQKSFTLPLDDQWGEDLEGQQADFSVTLHEVKRRIVPGLDDDLARTVSDFDTLEELRQDISEQFEAEKQRQADNEYAEEALAALIAGATIEYPPDMVEEQIDVMIEDLEERLQGQGLTLERYLELTDQTAESFGESLRPQAEQRIRRGMVLGELTRREKLDVGGTEIEEHIDLLSADWGEHADELRHRLSEPESVRSISGSLLIGKAFQRLVAIARGEAPPLVETEQEPVAEPEAAPVEAASVVAEPSEPDTEGAPDTAVAQEPTAEPDETLVAVESVPTESEETPDVDARDT